jgi:transposase-like protein
MDTRMIKQEIRLRQLAEIVKECQSSGKPVKAWCQEQGIKRQTYYSWQKAVREAVCEQLQSDCGFPVAPTEPVFAEISRRESPLSMAPAVTVRIGEAACDIYNGADAKTVEGTLLTVMRALC